MLKIKQNDFPKISGVKFDGFNKNTKFIPFNYAKSTKDKKQKSIHFYLDDYQFERVWNKPYNYLRVLSEFEYICQPDFSLFSNMALPVQIYNHYRKQYIANFYEENGLTVIPTISWSDERSFDFCFEGVPKNSVVTISTVGIKKNQKAKEQFLVGYNKMLETIQPEAIILYGEVLSGEIKKCENTINIESFSKTMRKRIGDK